MAAFESAQWRGTLPPTTCGVFGWHRIFPNAESIRDYEEAMHIALTADQTAEPDDPHVWALMIWLLAAKYGQHVNQMSRITGFPREFVATVKRNFLASGLFIRGTRGRFSHLGASAGIYDDEPGIAALTLVLMGMCGIGTIATFDARRDTEGRKKRSRRKVSAETVQS